MTTRPRVAVLRTKPETVLQDIERLVDLAGVRSALDVSRPTILKDNISWHFPFPGANTTPWQLEGTTLALRKNGFQELVCVQNKTVVTNAFKGEDLNHYVPIFQRYSIPVLYNFRDTDMKWIEYRPKAKMLVLDKIFPEGIRIPDYFVGKNIVHLPTTKCVAGDTQVQLEDGTVLTLAELVAKRESDPDLVAGRTDGERPIPGHVSLLSMTADGRLRAHEAAWLWRTELGDRRLLRLRTRTGRTLVATEDHPLLTPNGWRRLGELEGQDRIAISRRIAIQGVSQLLPQTHAASLPVRPEARPGRRFSVDFVRRVIDAYADGKTTTDIATQEGVQWQTSQALLRRHGIPLRRNVAQLRIPERTSEGFWRWIGYVMAEGSIEGPERGSRKLWWTNTTPELRQDFQRLTRELFGLEARPHRNNPGMHIYSRALGLYLEEIGLPFPLHSGNKRVPPALFRCPDSEVAAFLAGYLDGDGHVARRQADLVAVTRSPDLARDLQLLYSRLGAVAFLRPVQSTIPGRWTEPRTYWQVCVSGAALLELAPKIRLAHPEKARRLEEHATRLQSSKQPSNWDVVPVPGSAFRAIREDLGLSRNIFGRPGSVQKLENEWGHPTPRIVRSLLATLDAADFEGEHRVALESMRVLASPDLAWDTVEAVDPVDASGVELFDVTVPDAGSFVGNGIVLHNCHIYTTTTGAMKNAFGGLLNTKRHYTHSWIHATLVDLLAIQKEIHSGIFAVMDGTTAGNGPGPRTMFPVIKNVMLASADQVAIDAVSAKMMGFDPLSLDYIRLAHEAGLGVGRASDIEIVGDTDAAQESWGFHVGDNGASRVGDLLWFSPLKAIQNLFFRTPLVNVFIAGSEVYHDFYRWPAKDRATFEKWRRTTAWGRLFDSYAATGGRAAAPQEPAAR